MSITKRDSSADIIRSLAVCLMIFANGAIFLPPEAYPYWLRFLFSIPAPLFVMVSGMMLGITQRRRALMYFMKRGFFVISVGVFIDVCINQIMPFQSCDVLYLIGVTLPLVYLLSSLPSSLLALFVGVICMIGWGCRRFIGYSALPFEISLSGVISSDHVASSVPYHWLIDGWFPLFPWSGLMLFGCLAGRFKRRIVFFKNTELSILVVSLLLLLGGGVSWYLEPPAAHVRFGYVELFYPMDLSITVFMVGLFLFLKEIFSSVSIPSFMKILILPGQMSMAAYILHLSFIKISGLIFHQLHSLNLFFLLSTWHVLLVLGACQMIQVLKKDREKSLPLVLGWLIGR